MEFMFGLAIVNWVFVKIKLVLIDLSIRAFVIMVKESV